MFTFFPLEDFIRMNSEKLHVNDVGTLTSSPRIPVTPGAPGLPGKPVSPASPFSPPSSSPGGMVSWNNLPGRPAGPGNPGRPWNQKNIVPTWRPCLSHVLHFFCSAVHLKIRHYIGSVHYISGKYCIMTSIYHVWCQTKWQGMNCIKGKFHPCFIFALFALWPEGEFKIGLIELSIKVYIRKM